jgi:hypothetical protein
MEWQKQVSKARGNKNKNENTAMYVYCYCTADEVLQRIIEAVML